MLCTLLLVFLKYQILFICYINFVNINFISCIKYAKFLVCINNILYIFYKSFEVYFFEIFCLLYLRIYKRAHDINILRVLF